MRLLAVAVVLARGAAQERSCEVGREVVEWWDGSSTCEVCAFSTYAPGGINATCTLKPKCPPGSKFAHNQNNESESVCILCGSGKYLENTAQYPTACLPKSDCGGPSSPTVVDRDDTVCECAAGQVLDGSSCVACPSSHYSTSSMTACEMKATCAPSEGFTDGGDPTKHGNRTCAACATGHYQASVVNHRDPCTAKNTSADCTGTFVAGDDSNVNSDDTKCLACAPGMHVNGAECAACALGKYSTAENSHNCTADTPCGPGESYTAGAGATTARSCTACAGGQYQNRTSHYSACTVKSDCGNPVIIAHNGTDTVRTYDDTACGCLAGQALTETTGSNYSYSFDGDNYACEDCGRAEYGTNLSSTCLPKDGCGPGQYFADGLSKTNKASRTCPDCPSGKYNDVSRGTSGEHAACTDYSMGCYTNQSWSPGNTTVDGTCTNCPEGYFMDEPGNFRLACKKECSPGQESTFYEDRVNTQCNELVRLPSLNRNLVGLEECKGKCTNIFYAYICAGYAVADGECRLYGENFPQTGYDSFTYTPGNASATEAACYTKRETPVCIQCAAKMYREGYPNPKLCQEKNPCIVGERFIDEASNRSSASARTCEACELGKYMANGVHTNSACYATSTCPEGTYYEQPNAVRASAEFVCPLCPDGTFNGDQNHTNEHCTEKAAVSPTCDNPSNGTSTTFDDSYCGCPAGQDNRTGGCSNCPDFKYSNGTMQQCAPMTNCSAGEYAVDIGLGLHPMSRNCYLCNAGTYTHAPNLDASCTDKTTKCTAGTHYTHDNTREDSNCTACPDGTYDSLNQSNYGFTFQESVCIGTHTVCDPGQKLSGATPTTPGTCMDVYQCPADTYFTAVAGGGGNCTACGDGTFKIGTNSNTACTAVCELGKEPRPYEDYGPRLCGDVHVPPGIRAVKHFQSDAGFTFNNSQCRTLCTEMDNCGAYGTSEARCYLYGETLTPEDGGVGTFNTANWEYNNGPAYTAYVSNFTVQTEPATPVAHCWKKVTERCTACPANRYSDDGKTCKSKDACGAGTFFRDTATDKTIAGSRTCIPCPAPTFNEQPVHWDEACMQQHEMCYAGKFYNHTDAADSNGFSCTGCGTGRFAPNSSHVPECRAHTAQACDTGQVAKPGNATVDTACTLCESGTYAQFEAEGANPVDVTRVLSNVNYTQYVDAFAGVCADSNGRSPKTVNGNALADCRVACSEAGPACVGYSSNSELCLLHGNDLVESWGPFAPLPSKHSHGTNRLVGSWSSSTVYNCHIKRPEFWRAAPNTTALAEHFSDVTSIGDLVGMFNTKPLLLDTCTPKATATDCTAVYTQFDGYCVDTGATTEMHDALNEGWDYDYYSDETFGTPRFVASGTMTFEDCKRDCGATPECQAFDWLEGSLGLTCYMYGYTFQDPMVVNSRSYTIGGGYTCTTAACLTPAYATSNFKGSSVNCAECTHEHACHVKSSAVPVFYAGSDAVKFGDDTLCDADFPCGPGESYTSGTAFATLGNYSYAISTADSVTDRWRISEVLLYSDRDCLCAIDPSLTTITSEYSSPPHTQENMQDNSCGTYWEAAPNENDGVPVVTRIAVFSTIQVQCVRVFQPDQRYLSFSTLEIPDTSDMLFLSTEACTPAAIAPTAACAYGSCTDCGPGTYQDESDHYSSSCKPLTVKCDAGEYLVPGNVTSNGRCEQCGAGTYTPLVAIPDAWENTIAMLMANRPADGVNKIPDAHISLKTARDMVTALVTGDTAITATSGSCGDLIRRRREAEGECVNVVMQNGSDWLDLSGQSCKDAYDGPTCPQPIRWRNGGYHAGQMCCNCGGGSTKFKLDDWKCDLEELVANATEIGELSVLTVQFRDQLFQKHALATCTAKANTMTNCMHTINHVFKPGDDAFVTGDDTRCVPDRTCDAGTSYVSTASLSPGFYGTCKKCAPGSYITHSPSAGPFVGYCGDANGVAPRTFGKTNARDCKERCAAVAGCVAYTINIRDNSVDCNFYGNTIVKPDSWYPRTPWDTGTDVITYGDGTPGVMCHVNDGHYTATCATAPSCDAGERYAHHGPAAFPQLLDSDMYEYTVATDATVAELELYSDEHCTVEIMSRVTVEDAGNHVSHTRDHNCATAWSGSAFTVHSETAVRCVRAHTPPAFTKLGDGSCMVDTDGHPPYKELFNSAPSVQDCQNACHNLEGRIGFDYHATLGCLCYGYDRSVFDTAGTVSTGEPAINVAKYSNLTDGRVCYTYEPPLGTATKLGDGGCLVDTDNDGTADGYPPSIHFFNVSSVQDCQNACHNLEGRIGFDYHANAEQQCFCFYWVINQPAAGPLSTNGEPAIISVDNNAAAACYTYPAPITVTLAPGWTLLGHGYCASGESEQNYQIQGWTDGTILDAKAACETNPECTGLRHKDGQYVLLNYTDTIGGEEGGDCHTYRREATPVPAEFIAGCPGFDLVGLDTVPACVPCGSGKYRPGTGHKELGCLEKVRCGRNQRYEPEEYMPALDGYCTDNSTKEDIRYGQHKGDTFAIACRRDCDALPACMAYDVDSEECNLNGYGLPPADVVVNSRHYEMIHITNICSASDCSSHAYAKEHFVGTGEVEYRCHVKKYPPGTTPGRCLPCRSGYMQQASNHRNTECVRIPVRAARKRRPAPQTVREDRVWIFFVVFGGVVGLVLVGRTAGRRRL